MKAELKSMAALQELDSQIIVRSRAIERIPAKISALDPPLIAARANVETRKKALAETEKKKKEKEQTLTENHDRIGKLKARTRDIKDNKTYQAHLKEIETADRRSYEIEDEILVFMEEIETSQAGLKAAGDVLRTVEADVARMRAELDAEVREAEEALSAMKARRDGFVSAISADNYALYMRLIGRKDGLAVVEARDEVCMGCNMNIMPQLFLELKRGEKMTFCPQCGRILFYREPPEE
jgi:hypothetical protein